jgi:hypothetical protein
MRTARLASTFPVIVKYKDLAIGIQTMHTSLNKWLSSKGNTIESQTCLNFSTLLHLKEKLVDGNARNSKHEDF